MTTQTSRPSLPLRRILRTAIALLLCLVLGFGAGFLTCLLWPPREEPEAETFPSLPEPEVIIQDTTPQGEPFLLTIATIEDVLRPASELVSMQYCYTDADTYENYKELFGKRIPFTTDKVVFTYDGTVSVGIDLAQVQFQIDNENLTISITMPELHVIANSIDPASFTFPYEEDSVFNDTGMPEFMDLIHRLEQQKLQEVMDNETFVQAARENARRVLTAFLTASEFTSAYRVLFV